MKNRQKFLKIVMVFILSCIITAIIGKCSKLLAKEDLISETKQGIVEIYSGFYTENGAFHRMKHASGFIINNQENQAYIVTVYNALKNTEKSKKKFCKKNKIPYKNATLNNSIQIVIKGDVMVEASVMTESEKENYSILQVNSKISEKSPVRFASNKNLVIGDDVYALGFRGDAGKYDNVKNRHTEFVAIDVTVSVGNVQDTGANKNGILYLQHSATITSGNTGGPLLNKEGYVIGINNAMLNEDDTYTYYSLPIDNVREILDNFEIPYKSMERNDVLNNYKKLLEESKKLLENNAYKASSKALLQETLTQASNITLDENTDINELDKLSEQLVKAQLVLELKMKTTKKIIIVLGVVIAFMSIWLVKLIVWKLKNKEKRNPEQRQRTIERHTPKNRSNRDERVEYTGQKQDNRQEFQQPRNTFIPQQGDGTVLLGSAMDFSSDFREQNSFYHKKSVATIKNLKTGQVMLLDKPEIYIGKKEEMNDFAVRNNSNVSKRHACISWENEKYYIRDLQSLNGTFVNGRNVEFGTMCKLKNKDKFALANEEFIFYETVQEMNR